MKKLFAIFVTFLLAAGCGGGGNGERTETEKKELKMENTRPRVHIETDMGEIVVELFPEVAPNHVKNFLDLINQGFYDGLTFHRIKEGFVIQGGDPNGDGTGNAGFVIPAEFSNLQHVPGTLAMARGVDPNSASCQFYICLAKRPDLDRKYTIFGQTVEGLDVVLKIGKVETDKATERPLEKVTMTRVWEEGK